MEAQENSPSKNLFENMTLSDKTDNPKKEIQLFSTKSLQTCRHAYVFCKICGKYGRKDVLKMTHFKAHSYVPASRHGFVLNGDEPKYDKFGDFLQYQLHFGLVTDPKPQPSPLESISKEDQLECQRFYWNISSKAPENKNQKGIKKAKNCSVKRPALSRKIRKLKSTNTGQIQTRQKSSKTPSSPKKNLSEPIIDDQATGTFETLGSTQSKVKRKTKTINLMQTPTRKAPKSKLGAKQLKKKTVKTLKITACSTPKQSSRELENLKLWKALYEPSKRIRKAQKIQVFAFTRQQIKQQASRQPKNPEEKSSRKRSWHNWESLIQKIRIELRIKSQKVVSQHFRQKYINTEESNRVEILDLNEQHKQLMLRERDKHCHLYNQSAKFESTQQKLHNQMICTRDQRNEINILLTRLAKYAKNEIANYPQNMIVGGVLDPHIWKLTREAATDEDLIKDLKQKLDKNNRNFEEISKQNLDFKNQIMYASNHIKMISDSTKLVIQNLFQFQQQGFQVINPLQPQQRDLIPAEQPNVPDVNNSQEEFQYCNEEVESELDSSMSDFSDNGSSLIKRVSFSSTESIVGKKWINSDNPKNVKEQLQKRQEKKQARKRKEFERIRMLYQKKNECPQLQALSNQNTNLNQVDTRIRFNQSEKVDKETHSDLIISRNKNA